MTLTSDTTASLMNHLRSKVARQADEIRRRDARIEALTADKRLLAFDCNKLRAENRVLRGAVEARGEVAGHPAAREGAWAVSGRENGASE